MIPKHVIRELPIEQVTPTGLIIQWPIITLNTSSLRQNDIKTSYRYNSSKLWNKIPNNIKSVHNLHLFKNYLKGKPHL